MAAVLDYRLAVYARLWDLIMVSETNGNAFKPANRVRLDTKAGGLKFTADKNAPADFPRIGIYYGPGTDSGFSARYGSTFDAGQAVDVQQGYSVRLTFERPDLVYASPLIAEVRAAILRGGPRLGGSGAGFPYVKLSGVANATNTIGVDENTGGTNRLVTTFDVSIAMVLTIGQLTTAV